MPIVMVGDGYVPEHGTLYYNNNPHDIKYIGEMNELKGGNQAHWGWRTIFSQRAWKQGEQDDVVVDNVFLT